MAYDVKILISDINCDNIVIENDGKGVCVMMKCEVGSSCSDVCISKSISALDLAKHTIYVAVSSGKTITNLKLQKIMYYLQGQFYKKFNAKLFDEPIEAWRLGPVVPDVYYYFSMYGSDPIKEEQDTKLCLSSEEISYLDKIIKEKSAKSSYTLVDDTHAETPWKKTTRNGENVGMGIEIPFSEIVAFFAQ